MYIVEAYLSIHAHCERLPIFIMKLHHYPIMVGIPCLKHHNATMYVVSNLSTFISQYYLAHAMTGP
jgi:hypothetical protein